MTNILVHCSAGVGRTGTLITLYKMMEEIEDLLPKVEKEGDSSNLSIDIFNTVFNFRSKRMYMVSIVYQIIFWFAIKLISFTVNQLNILNIMISFWCQGTISGPIQIHICIIIGLRKRGSRKISVSRRRYVCVSICLRIILHYRHAIVKC